MFLKIKKFAVSCFRSLTLDFTEKDISPCFFEFNAQFEFNKTKQTSKDVRI